MKELIKTLNKLSLQSMDKYPVEEISKYIESVGQYAGIGYTLHPGFSILRGRANESEDISYSKRGDLSFKPQEWNNTFQRASTPNRTMFYGGVVLPESGEQEFKYPRLPTIFEASSTYRNNKFISNEKISFGRWEVQKDINLMLILPDVRERKGDSFVAFMQKQLENNLKGDLELLQKTRLVNRFFGHEFSKENIRFDYDYLISALYTESIVAKGFDGILYPSVKSQGLGYNVCITPECVNSSMKLTAAGEGRIHKVGYVSEIVGEAEILIEDDSKPFKFNRMDTYKDPKEIIDNLYNEYQ